MGYKYNWVINGYFPLKRENADDKSIYMCFWFIKQNKRKSRCIPYHPKQTDR